MTNPNILNEHIKLKRFKMKNLIYTLSTLFLLIVLSCNEDIIDDNSYIRIHDTNSPKKLHLSPIQKEDLIAFLQILTDQESVTHERFSNPFK